MSDKTAVFTAFAVSHSILRRFDEQEANPQAPPCFCFFSDKSPVYRTLGEAREAAFADFKADPPPWRTAIFEVELPDTWENSVRVLGEGTFCPKDSCRFEVLRKVEVLGEVEGPQVKGPEINGQ